MTTHTGNEKILGEGDFIRLHSRDGWEFVSRKGVTGIVVIVPVTDDGRIVLVEQYRHAVQKAVIELPAGLVGDKPGQMHEDLPTAAHRELLEETGYEAQRMVSLVSGPKTHARDYLDGCLLNNGTPTLRGRVALALGLVDSSSSITSFTYKVGATVQFKKL